MTKFCVALAVLLAVGLCCAGPHAWRTHQQNLAIEAVHKLRGHVDYAHEAFGAPALPGPDLLRCLIGEDHFVTVTGVQLGNRQATDQSLEPLSSLTQLRELVISDSGFSGAGLAHMQNAHDLRILNLSNTKTANNQLQNLRAFPDLRELYLGRTPIGPGGLAEVAKLSRLEALGLEKTRISDDDVRALAPLTHLAWLQLDGTPITDACVPALVELSQLRELSIRDTGLTGDARQRLQAELPNTKIY